MINVGTTAISKVHVGSVEAQAVYVGSTLVWSNLSDMGMDKLGAMSGTTSAALVTGWTARAGSTVIGDQLVSNGTGSKTIKWKATLASSAGAGGQVFDLRQNGNIIATVTIPTLSTTTTFADVAVDLSTGDTIDLWKRAASPARNIAATGTWIYWE